MEKRFAVTAATGALGPVLGKLAALLGDEYKLQEGTRRGIESIKSELEPVHHLLWKLWGSLDLDVACKNWMTEARELSYDMEDDIDGFTLGLERGDGSFIQREATDSPFMEFMERVKDVSKRCGEMQKIGDGIICNRSKLTTDPRALFLHKDASELVGMEPKKKEIIQLLQKNEMVCILGAGGMGKTTLADLVYHAVGDEFQCRAFVSVHPSPNMTEILGIILSQVTDCAMSAGSGTEPAAEQNMVTDISISLSEKSGTEPAAEQNDFIKGISNFLSDERYLVIIDDIWHWEEWEVIRNALPKSNMGSKIIMTTRVKALADKCRTEQGAHVYTQSFHHEDAKRLSDMILNKSVGRDILEANAQWLSRNIVHTSGLMPLAIICLSSAWAESHHVLGDDAEYWYIWVSEVLMDRFLSTPSLKPLVQSLCLVFDDLPVELRTCLLYCSIYPLGYFIQRDCLVRKWIAERFVSQQEVSEAYFDKLVSRNLLQPVPKYQSFYIVHPIMLAFLVCRAKEDNFVACRQHNNGRGSSSHAKQIRRLSLDTDCIPDEDVVSHIRSLAVLSDQPHIGVPLKKFKNLRVLEIDSCKRLENFSLVDICGLIWLRYLGLNGCLEITEIPREIWRLQNLETLEVRNTSICKLPMEIGTLVHLRTLNVSGTMVTEVPREITGLSRLENLDVSSTRVKELPKEVGKLQELRTLDIRVTKVRELPRREIPNSFLSVVGHFDSSSGRVVKLPLGVFRSSGDEQVISSSGANCRESLSILVLFNHLYKRCEVLPVPMHRVAGRHMKVPQWVKQDLCNVCSLDISLWKLVEEDLEFLKTQMPNLQALQLRFEVLPREPVAITGGGFLKLETFYVDCRLPRVITFWEGAMPKLKHLEFKFYTGTTSQHYSMGIKHLDSLEKVVFRCSEYYTSDSPGIRETIDVLRKEAVEHPQEITLWVNDKPEVFGNRARKSEGLGLDIEKEFEEWEKQIERRATEIAAVKERIREQRLRLSTAAEGRAQRDKNNARAGIEKEIQERKSKLEIREQRLREEERYYNIK
ncbi:hypothetical protein SEVIR_8G249881v4 [Setaria viridis]|uniref:NB-ARC domain-containing protein n=1 Tax=Setaria viridis TaxID=4556 RepID=A0A4U6TJD2_SETVI|nr:disease resistance protein PIK5-NP-like isoform X2 [Setaria viridis]TKW02571.1 hypothetical protein SEVIR_8G249881v2 [Setaria viridis]TKW02574.1 hypothetical protein SEVIR_8G249881v2 [Setaria viridis]